MNKFVRQALLWLLALAMMISSGVALAESDNEQIGQVHFVLVIDCTGSMDDADSEGMSIAAAELFVDMLPMENTTISVICFGKQWKKTYEFKSGVLEEMKPFLDHDGEYYGLLHSDNRYINALCELASLKNVTERSELKSAIEDAEEYVGADTMTVANTAMLAAIDLLKHANAEPGNACIVLMSDGRVQVGRREAMDAVTALNSYPSYVLELNYDEKNTTESIAREQLVDIAAKYDGDRNSNRYIEVKSAGDVIQAVSSVIGRFIDLQAVNPTKIEVVGGESEAYEFFVPEMASETNIVVTGEGFRSMVVESPEGNPVAYENTDTIDPNNTFIRNGNKYAVLKIKRPTIGTWSVKIFGESGTNIYIHAVSAKELNLVLRASGCEPESKEYWLKNDIVPFTAAFEYEGDIVTSQTFYQKNPAELYIKNLNTNQQIGPIISEASGNGYRWDIPLQEAGMLEVTAHLSYAEFRDGGKTSNSMSYFVKNLELTLGEGQTLALPETMYVNEETKPIDVSGIFVNPDSDEVVYSIASKNQDSLSGDMTARTIEQGVIALRMPSKEGEYHATLSARDANMQQPISIEFLISVENRLIQEIKKLSLDTIVINQPTWLGGQSNTKSYNLNEYYVDPDGLPLIYALESGKTDDPNVSIRLDGSILTINADATGSERAKLTVTDSSGDSREVSLNIKCENWVVVLFKANWYWFVLAVAVLIIVLALLRARRVKGGWYVSISGVNDDDVVSVRFSTLASQRSLKKPKIALLDVLRCAEGMNDDKTQNLPSLNYVTEYPKMYGRLFVNRVTFKGIDTARSQAEVLLDDKRLHPRKKKVVMKPGQHLEFRYSNSMSDETLNVLLEME